MELARRHETAYNLQVSAESTLGDFAAKNRRTRHDGEQQHAGKL